MNTNALELFNITADLHGTYEGVAIDKDGNLTGRIFKDAVEPLLPKIAPYLLNPAHIEKGFNGFETILARGGVTTIAEMGYGIFGREFENKVLARHYSADDPYALYLVPEHRAFSREFGKDSAAKMVEFAETDTRILPQVKLFTDAAFYSQTMKLAAPGYLSGQSKGTDGLWVTQPADLPELMARYWDAGLDIHIHSNGDAAQDSTLAAFARQSEGKDGQRLIIEHAGLITPTQMAKTSELGIGISAASHYVNFMGQDYKPVIEEKADYITPLASAFGAGLRVTVHSDAPLAPPMPLLAAGRHMTRATREGGISTPREKLTADQAKIIYHEFRRSRQFPTRAWVRVRNWHDRGSCYYDVCRGLRIASSQFRFLQDATENLFHRCRRANYRLTTFNTHHLLHRQTAPEHRSGDDIDCLLSRRKYFQFNRSFRPCKHSLIC